MNLTAPAVDRLFAALADPVRVRLAGLLGTAPDGLCVCELVDAVREPQPNVSRHLRVLKDAGLVAERREGRWVYYFLRQLEHPLLKAIRCCVDEVCCCSDVQEDVERLRVRLRLRRGGKCVVGSRAPSGRRRGGRGGEPHVRLPVVHR